VLLSFVALNWSKDNAAISLLESSQHRPVSKAHFQELYDIPNFVYQRTQMHFPQAEESWLNMAAAGKIGDDVKPQPILNKLNDIISDARTHALTENYEARVKAKKLAVEENYSTYDVQKGKVIHKIYGKQVGGSTTLKQLPQLSSMQSLSELPSKSAASSATVVPYAVQVPKGLRSGQQFIAQIPEFGRMLVTVPAGAKAGQLVAIQVPNTSRHSTQLQNPEAYPKFYSRVCIFWAITGYLCLCSLRERHLIRLHLNDTNNQAVRTTSEIRVVYGTRDRI
jgi:hypothetical protein